MNIQKRFSLGVAFFMALSLSLLLIGSIKLLQAERSQTAAESQTVINQGALTATVTPTNRPIQTVTPTITPTVTATNSPLYLPIFMKQPTPTPTPTLTPTSTPIPTPTPTITLTPTPNCLSAEQEPNNGFGDADLHYRLCENVEVSGSFPNEDDDDDLYVIESKSGHLSLWLTHIPAGTNYELVLYHGTTRIAESLNAGNLDEEIVMEDVEAGRYYARVFRRQGSSPEPYFIRWQNE